MPTIPTPFIGGGEERRRDLSPERQIARPYVPGEGDSAPTEPRQAREHVDVGPVPAEEEAAPEEQMDVGVPEAASAAPPAEALPESAPEPARGSAPEIPDFLLGPDGATSGKAEKQMPSDEADREDLQAASEELLAGDLGDRIRSLTRDLAGQPPEVSISRAFAAGYRAGRERG